MHSIDPHVVFIPSLFRAREQRCRRVTSLELPICSHDSLLCTFLYLSHRSTRWPLASFAGGALQVLCEVTDCTFAFGSKGLIDPSTATSIKASPFGLW